ncbi:hypothetical protein [Allokutzneria oryzae]|uniref:Uncharacterized protein n=1 Tax=Allokutzneria oryzae TaxID=1378989 RepID=A0ABV5ZRQ9_9PSEU
MDQAETAGLASAWFGQRLDDRPRGSSSRRYERPIARLREFVTALRSIFDTGAGRDADRDHRAG